MLAILMVLLAAPPSLSLQADHVISYRELTRSHAWATFALHYARPDPLEAQH